MSDDLLEEIERVLSENLPLTNMSYRYVAQLIIGAVNRPSAWTILLARLGDMNRRLDAIDRHLGLFPEQAKPRRKRIRRAVR